MEKAREFQKNIYLCFIDYAKAFDCVDHTLDLGLGQQKSHPLHTHTISVSLSMPLRTQRGTWQATEHFFHKGVVMTD